MIELVVLKDLTQHPSHITSSLQILHIAICVSSSHSFTHWIDVICIRKYVSLTNITTDKLCIPVIDN